MPGGSVLTPRRYAVLGSIGQLGCELCRILPGEVIALTRKDLDLSQPSNARLLLKDLKPDVLLNCAAYNLVDRAEQEPGVAFAVNAWGVRELALACRDLDCTLAHFSTDYVFGLDETRCTPYLEEDAPGPLSLYGLSKLVGEYLVRSLCPKHFVVRTCGLYSVRGQGGKGGNFVETMLRLAKAEKPLRVVNDQVCTPSYTVDVAAAVAALVQTDCYGLVHITNSGSCSWYEFAREIFERFDTLANLTPISSKEFGALARRPSYSVLATSRAAKIPGLVLRGWKDALSAYLEERDPLLSPKGGG
ncbi:MAG TPA: dTDP-4-dehydrorhamnose reductase [Gemmataceae bacterium]|nr:dTDP-4-dehydrorhamnose reductase [Gemmataceae bacterium]